MVGKPGSPEAQMIPAAAAHQPASPATATGCSRCSPGFSQLLRKETGRSQGGVLCEDPSDTVGTQPLNLPAYPPMLLEAGNLAVRRLAALPR